jgi:hypothetical protein
MPFLKKPGIFAMMVALAAASTACLETAPGTRGELGTGGFNYACTGWGDPVCESRFSDSLWQGEPTGIGMPIAIAVGGRFGVTFSSDDPSDFDPRTVAPASATQLEARTVGYQALEPGWAALLARDGAGNVVDLTHVQIVEPTRLVVTRPSTSVRVGTSVSFEGEVRDRDGITLAGALDYDWEVDDPSIARVVALQTDPDSIYDDAVSLEALAVGTVTVTVTAGGLTETLEITVQE